MDSTGCDALRAAVMQAKRDRNDALARNAVEVDCGRLPPHSKADLDVLRLTFDLAVHEARSAGCDVDDLAGADAGRL